jgi:hypothetical protein
MKRPSDISWFVSEPKRCKYAHVSVTSQPYFDYYNNTITVLKHTYMILPHNIFELIHKTWNDCKTIRDPKILSSWVVKYIQNDLLSHYH